MCINYFRLYESWKKRRKNKICKNQDDDYQIGTILYFIICVSVLIVSTKFLIYKLTFVAIFQSIIMRSRTPIEFSMSHWEVSIRRLFNNETMHPSLHTSFWPEKLSRIVIHNSIVHVNWSIWALLLLLYTQFYDFELTTDWMMYARDWNIVF